MERVILHSDLNNFFASVECLYNNEIRNKPVIVCGSSDDRHGIVLAKNDIAKKYDIKTADTVILARKKCRNVVCVPPHFSRYIKYSKLVRKIYLDYSDMIEPFSIDEAWIDVTGSTHLYGSGKDIANMIRTRIKKEIGLTVSIGVSFNKIFAKLGSDMKKPDAVTVINKDNFKEKIFNLNTGDLLCVGRSTKECLARYGIMTIGDIANSNVKFLKQILGKNGETIWSFANGYDNSPVSKFNEKCPVKSIGNSTTTPRSLTCNDDVKTVFYLLAESVATRMREQNLKCKTISISIRNDNLFSFERQCQFDFPTSLAVDLEQKAMELFINSYDWEMPVRSIGLRACRLIDSEKCEQTNLFEKDNKKNIILENVVDNLRDKFGHESIKRALMLKNKNLTKVNPKDDHTIHPTSYF